MDTHAKYNHRCSQTCGKPATPAIGFGELLFARLHLAVIVFGMHLRRIAGRGGRGEKICAAGLIWRKGHLRRLSGKIHIHRQNARQLTQGLVHPPHT